MNYKITFSDEFKRQYRKLAKRDKQIVMRIDKKLDDILNDPFVGKPLRYVHKGKRRVHIGHFVLMYSIDGDNIIIEAFEHHNDVY